jgi:O-antigen/teichoic acid export membrane protein
MTSQSPPNTNNTNPTDTTTDKPAANFFDTSHLKADIKGRSVRGGIITVAAQAAKIILHTGSTAILARLLTPADFGLVAMVSVFTEFVNLFKDLGLSMATIQKKDITHQQVTNLFWVNIGMSCLLILVAAAISPFIARFYGEPRLILITIAIGSTFIFGGLMAQHTALMRRQMQFRALAIIEIIAMAASFMAAIISALLGLTYWSLIIMIAVRGAANTILVWWISPWRPGRPVRGSGIRPMLAFGGNLTGSNVLGYLSRNSDNVIIGYALGPASLGIYTKAYGLLTLPLWQFSLPLRSIMIPALSRLQDEPKQYRRFFLQVLSAVFLITIPMVTFLFISADEIINIILGSQWAAAITAFRYLAPAAFCSAISYAPGWLFITTGRTRAQFRWALLSTPVTVIGFMYGVKWGVNGVAASFSITYSVMFMLYIYWATRESPVRFHDIIQTLAVPALSSLLAALAAALTGRFLLGSNIVVRFAVCSIVFAVCYFTCVIATSTGRQIVRSLLSVISILRKKPMAIITE